MINEHFLDKEGKLVTEQDTATRRPGRPRKHAERRHLSARLVPRTYDALRAAADENRRSASEEAAARIERSFTDDVLLSIKRELDEITRERADQTAELLQIAIDRIKERDARIQELETYIDKLQSEKSLSEETIERAIVRAFAKMGEVK